MHHLDVFGWKASVLLLLLSSSSCNLVQEWQNETINKIEKSMFSFICLISSSLCCLSRSSLIRCLELEGPPPPPEPFWEARGEAVVNPTKKVLPRKGLRNGIKK